MRIPDIPDFYERLAEMEVLDIETGKTSLKGVSMDDERLVKLRVLLKMNTKKDNQIGRKAKPVGEFLSINGVDIKRVNELLEDRGLSNGAIADVLDVDISAAWKKLNGAIRWRKQEVERVAHMLGVNTEDIRKE